MPGRSELRFRQDVCLWQKYLYTAFAVRRRRDAYRNANIGFNRPLHIGTSVVLLAPIAKPLILPLLASAPANALLVYRAGLGTVLRLGQHFYCVGLQQKSGLRSEWTWRKPRSPVRALRFSSIPNGSGGARPKERHAACVSFLYLLTCGACLRGLLDRAIKIPPTVPVDVCGSTTVLPDLPETSRWEWRPKCRKHPPDRPGDRPGRPAYPER
jgi:hypothetical protein